MRLSLSPSSSLALSLFLSLSVCTSLDGGITYYKDPSLSSIADEFLPNGFDDGKMYHLGFCHEGKGVTVVDSPFPTRYPVYEATTFYDANRYIRIKYIDTSRELIDLSYMRPYRSPISIATPITSDTCSSIIC